MKNYYEELKKYLTYRNYSTKLDQLEKSKSNPVEVIKMYNVYSKDIKDYLDQEKQHSMLGLKEGKIYTIKSEDKAAFINRLEKLGIAVDTYKIHDNKMDGSFSIEFIDPNVINMVNQTLKNSPKIDQVKTPKNVYTDKGMKIGGSELKEVENPIDVIKLDVPLFIRLLEYAREDAKTDMDLHDVTEKIIAAASKGQTLTMTDYDMIMSNKIQENFNPEDYEWEEEVDPKILNISGKLDTHDYIDCNVLTIDGEEKELRFYIVPDSVDGGSAICEAEDEGIIYAIGCDISNWGIDGNTISNIDKTSLEYYVK